MDNFCNKTLIFGSLPSPQANVLRAVLQNWKVTEYADLNSALKAGPTMLITWDAASTVAIRSASRELKLHIPSVNQLAPMNVEWYISDLMTELAVLRNTNEVLTVITEL